MFGHELLSIPVKNGLSICPIIAPTLLFMYATPCNQVQNLSGGELQRVALTLCLGKPADVYLIDEPSAYLDSEQRLHAAKVIKRSVVLLFSLSAFKNAISCVLE